METLWEAIFETTRINTENPVETWKNHDQTLAAKAESLNEKQFTSLHYTAPGTDLTIGLPKTIFGLALVVRIKKDMNLWPICQQKKFSVVRIN